MKVNANNLSGIQLDYAITLIVDPDALQYGIEVWRERRSHTTKHGEFCHRYHQSDAQAGPILRKYHVGRKVGHSGVWVACYHYDLDDEGRFMASGLTDIEAGLRSVVLMNLGNEVDIPEELL